MLPKTTLVGHEHPLWLCFGRGDVELGVVRGESEQVSHFIGQHGGWLVTQAAARRFFNADDGGRRVVEVGGIAS